jgi:hypothetical protein
MIIVIYIYIYLLVYEISLHLSLTIGVLDRAFGYESRELEFDSGSKCLFSPKIGKKEGPNYVHFRTSYGYTRLTSMGEDIMTSCKHP